MLKANQCRHNVVTPLLLKAASRLLSTEDTGYIHKSVIPTQHFQKSLPRLPIPKLEDSCRRYLDALQPILTKEEYSATVKIVNDFQNGRGKELQTHLIAMDKQNKDSSYIHGPWTDIYQKDRRSVVLNHNPFLGFVDDPVTENNKQVNKATNLILSSMRFFRTYRDNILEPDMYHMNPKKSDTDRFKNLIRLVPSAMSWYGAYLAKVFPLCMRQYPYLFQSTRIPLQDKDENRRYPESRHITVVHKGYFYAFDVLDTDGNMIDGDAIKSCLQQIVNDPRERNYKSLGYFTSLDRNKWAAIRSELDRSNPDVMLAIDSAMFVLCLDDYAVAKSSHSDDIAEEDAVDLIKNGLHGEGYNRWYDKSFNMIVTENGKAAIHFEHSWGDGVSVFRYFNEIHADSIKRPHSSSNDSTVQGNLRYLDPVLSSDLVKSVEEAKLDFDKVTSGFKLDVIKFQSFGKKDLKSLKLSPDSICQLSFQMAYWRFKQSFVGSYESCSTAAFSYGRTETIRPCTKETKLCSMAFDQDHPANMDAMSDLLRACSKKHSQLTKEAATGQGFDRHLLALRHLNDLQNGSPIDLYTDPNYAKLNYIVLSTSTLVSPSLEVGGFAAVVPDGLGVGYAMFDDWFGCQASYYPPGNDGSEFIKHMGTVCDDLHAVLNGKNIKEGRKV